MISLKVTPEMITTEICSRASLPLIFDLLKKNEKTIENIETLIIKDG
jgi:hypothetical protein